MYTELSDGAEVYRESYFRGLRPDPDLWIDEWAYELMRIPRDTGAPEPSTTRPVRPRRYDNHMRCWGGRRGAGRGQNALSSGVHVPPSTRKDKARIIGFCCINVAKTTVV